MATNGFFCSPIVLDEIRGERLSQDLKAYRGYNEGLQAIFQTTKEEGGMRPDPQHLFNAGCRFENPKARQEGRAGGAEHPVTPRAPIVCDYHSNCPNTSEAQEILHGKQRPCGDLPASGTKTRIVGSSSHVDPVLVERRAEAAF